jgi:hypothetical protein
VYWQDYQIALDRHAERLRQAEQDRLLRTVTANQSAPAANNRLARRALVRLGGLLAAVGVTLQG